MAASATVLVVDDSAVDRRLAGRLIEKGDGLSVLYAADGSEALGSIERQPPDIVVTDLLMPNMTGLELVATIRERHPLVPVILMTGHGSEDTAVAALRQGAASYVPKRELAGELLKTVQNVLEIARGERDEQQVLDALAMNESHFVLGNEVRSLPAFVRHLEALLVHLGLFDDSERIQVAVALREALANAIYHGNLELSSALREDGACAYDELAAQRRGQSPFSERRVHVVVRHTREQVTYVIRDEGGGFDPSALPDPTDPRNLERVHGRGLLLIRTFMDEVRHNELGNEITMVKRRPDRPAT